MNCGQSESKYTENNNSDASSVKSPINEPSEHLKAAASPKNESITVIASHGENASYEMSCPNFLMQMLANCDIALFVYDSSDGSLWKRAAELHVGVASQGENVSYEMPCLIIAATDDLDPYPHGNSHLHAGPTHTYIQLHGHPWHANFSGHESLPFISPFFTILGFGNNFFSLFQISLFN